MRTSTPLSAVPPINVHHIVLRLPGQQPTGPTHFPNTEELLRHSSSTSSSHRGTHLVHIQTKRGLAQTPSTNIPRVQHHKSSLYITSTCE